MAEKPTHSLLGASSAERWLNCPGSVGLLKKLNLPESDEPDYRRDGVAAHEAAAHCLQNGLDGWEAIGLSFHETEITEEIANAIQLYLDTVRPLITEKAVVRIETRVQFKEHEDGYGTVDCGVYDPETATLHVNDYKHGQGVVVEADWNPQLMYYAHPFIQEFPETRTVVLRIIQPRAFHELGPVREWETTAEAIETWVEDELIPGMNRAAIDHALDSGPWCRFCPAKLVCPILTSLFGAAMTADPKSVRYISNESLGRSYQYIPAVKSYIKAMEDEAFRLLNLGKEVPGVKLVPKKANRAWKPGGADIAKARFGDQAMTVPEVKSPAQIEALSPDGKAVVSEWAFTPQTGLTVALSSDKRPAVKVQSTQATFGEAVAKIAAE